MPITFSEAEVLSRRQFSAVFCEGQIFYRCDKYKALNEAEWTISIIDDILHQMFPQNVLGMDSIETIVQMLGWDKAGLYFNCIQTVDVADFILPYISSYVSNQTFIHLKLLHQDKTVTNCGEFYNTFFTHHKCAWVKISRFDLYKYYKMWCNRTDNCPVSIGTFTQAFAHFGHKVKKGYLNGKSGATYYEIKFDPSEVKDYVQPQISEERREEQKQERTECTESLRNVGWAGNQILQQPIQRKESDVSAIERRQDTSTGDGGGITKHVENDSDDQGDSYESTSDGDTLFRRTDPISESQQIRDITDNREDTNESVNTSNDQFTSSGDRAAAKSDKTGTTKNTNQPIFYPNDPTRIIERLKELPREVHNFLTDYRLLYKTIEEYRDFTFFTAEMEANNFHYEEMEMQQLFALLEEYASNDLRELKKGAR